MRGDRNKPERCKEECEKAAQLEEREEEETDGGGGAQGFLSEGWVSLLFFIFRL